MKTVVATAALIGVSLGSPCCAQQLPTHVDLRAAYCMKIVQYQLSLLSTPPDNPAPQVQQAYANYKDRVSSNLRRLQLYLVPRVPYLDATGLLAASKSGEEDIHLAEQYGARCAEACKTNVDPVDCVLKCSQDSEMSRRARQCNDLSWLPF